MRPTQRLGKASVLLLLLLGACRNECQLVCVRMADYAEECGFVVDETDVDRCLDEQSGSASKEDRADCKEYNAPETIRNEWTCEELEQYFDPEPEE